MCGKPFKSNFARDQGPGFEPDFRGMRRESSEGSAMSAQFHGDSMESCIPRFRFPREVVLPL